MTRPKDDRLDWSDIDDITDATRWKHKNVWFLVDRKDSDGKETRVMSRGRMTAAGIDGVTIVLGLTQFQVPYPFKIKLHESAF